MAKGQMRSNKETRKPKKDKAAAKGAATAGAPLLKAAGAKPKK